MINLFDRLSLFGFPCLFQMITGLYCPGCGGTRAIRALLQGKLVHSFTYHPLVPYIACCVLLVCLSWMLSKLLKKPSLIIYQYNRFVYVGIVIVVINWVLKNYMLIVRKVDLLSML